MLPKNGVRCQEPQFKLSLWDKNDGWIDVCEPGSEQEMNKAWKKETKNGTQFTKYEHGSYFKVASHRIKCPNG